VIATAGASSRARVISRGAREVLDYRDQHWPRQVLRLTGGEGVTAAVNAARNGAAVALTVVRNGGRLATITSDPPPTERGIVVSTVYVRPDGRQLVVLAELLAQGLLTLPIGGTYPLVNAADALAKVLGGAAGQAIVVVP
jgi:NADPH:quinone reductase-like Zn-dependent oxidoreductase